jgi:hypothetical protein
VASPNRGGPSCQVSLTGRLAKRSEAWHNTPMTLCNDLTNAAHRGDLADVTALLPQVPPADRRDALTRACDGGHDAVACALLEAGVTADARTWDNLLNLAANAGAAGAVERLLTQEPTLRLTDALASALKAHRLGVLAVLVPRVSIKTLDKVHDTLLYEWEDKHGEGIEFEEIMNLFDQMTPWLPDTHRQHLLVTHHMALLPKMAAHQLAQARADEASHTPPAVPVRPHRRRT